MAQEITLPTVAILGPGAVGGFLAAAFSKAGAEVTCVVRPERIEFLRENGIHVKSQVLGDVHVFPRIVANLDRETDFVFIATKATALSDALTQLPKENLSRAVLVPLLNGFEHLNVLRQKLERPVITATIHIESKYLGPGQVAQTSPHAKIEAFAGAEIGEERATAFSKLLSTSSLKSEFFSSEAEVIWRKLAKLNPLACSTAAYDRPLGDILLDPTLRAELIASVEETVAVGTRAGFAQRPEDVFHSLEKLPASIGTSLQRDVNSGKPTEIDAIPGAVVRLGKKLGLECPVVRSLVEKIETRIESKKKGLQT